jgi:hypothetical protein
MARRSSPPPAILVIVLAVAAFLLLRYFRKPPPPAFTCGVHCGTERWRIKTIFDNDAKRINFQPRHTSISELVSLPAPEVLSDERADEEKQVYSVEAVLLGWKQETEHGDRDFHLVLADPNDVTRTMIAEVPSAECQGACSSAQAQHYVEVRQVLTAQLAEPQAHFRRLTPAWVLRVEGVGFFDIFHQQIGVAENCMELHPLLKVEFVRQLGPEFPLPHRIEPPARHQCGRLDRDARFADEK